jgi:predicted RNA-binding Zn ribbon-like protein
MSLPAWVAPGETKPAPLPLLLVQAFVNTFEADTDTDLLREPDTARRWFAAAGLAGAAPAIGYEQLHRAREVRESIRCVLAENAGGRAPGACDLEPLRAAAGTCAPRFEIDPSGRVQVEPSPDPGSEIAWTRLLLVIRDAQTDGTWQHLKACENHECGWAFYDRSRGRRGRWCEMSVCGNRMKNRSLRARRRA